MNRIPIVGLKKFRFDDRAVRIMPLLLNRKKGNNEVLIRKNNCSLRCCGDGCSIGSVWNNSVGNFRWER